MPAARDPRRPFAAGALAKYVLAWLTVPVAVGIVVVLVLRDRDDEVALPPVQATQLSAAVAKARCNLRRGAGDAREPVVDGPASDAAPAAAGVYQSPPAVPAIVAALRRGTIVIHYRPDLTDTVREGLEVVQSAVPHGTILTANPRLPYALAVTAWHRVLACTRYTTATLDAIRLFRGRYVGSGPDASARAVR